MLPKNRELATLLTFLAKQGDILYRFYPSYEKIYTNIAHKIICFCISAQKIQCLPYAELLNKLDGVGPVDNRPSNT